MNDDAPALLYLEADDEITAVLRRVRAADPGRVILVAPGRSRATSSVVALRLLAGEGRDLAVVGDALTRSLAAEAGLAAYATVDDARRAAPGEAPPAPEQRQAAIHVVRGDRHDDTAPTLAAAPLVNPEVGEETRPVALSRPPRPQGTVRTPPPPPRRRTRRAPPRRSALIAVLGLLAAFIVVASVVGAMVLPAATVTIAPRTEVIGPTTYTIAIDAPRQESGTVTADATVTATGTYAVQQAASGTVVFFNWTFFPVTVTAGTLVAAGEQAFATQAEITVERGRLTGQGTIRAGEEAVAVVAAAPGAAGNVPAEAINQVLDAETDARLRGFPENTRPTVTNPEPTSGGLDSSGPEFAQADLDAATTSLTDELRQLAAEALPEPGDQMVLPTAIAPEPVLTVPEGLVGTRDQPEATISGTLDWSVWLVDRAAVEDEARNRFIGDGASLPDGLQLLSDQTQVDVGDARLLEGDRVEVDVTVTGVATSEIDPAEVIARIRGLGPDEAQLALADLGPARVDLWPGWVTTVPDMEWRIEVRVEGADLPSGGPSPSDAAASASP